MTPRGEKNGVVLPVLNRTTAEWRAATLPHLSRPTAKPACWTVAKLGFRSNEVPVSLEALARDTTDTAGADTAPSVPDGKTCRANIERDL